MTESSESPHAQPPSGPVHPGIPAQEGEFTSEAEHGHSTIDYERKDVPFRWILVGAVAFIGIGFGMFVLIYTFFLADTAHLATRRDSEFPLAEHPSEALPAEPRLEEIDRLNNSPRENVYQRLEAREDQLDLYGATQEQGYVRIPIRRAMESLAGHLPVRMDQPAPGKDNGLVDSGASNSGRLFRGAPP
jgi:hypothetical protein